MVPSGACDPLYDARVTEAQPFRRRIFRNTLAVGAGNVWAVVVSLVALPITLRGLGATAFGTWVLISTFSASAGWFSIADGGIGAATTREVAAHASVEDAAGSQRTVAAGMAVYGVLGIAFAAAFGLVGRQALPHLFTTPSQLVDDVRFAVAVYAVQVLFDQFTNVVAAILDGLQRVDRSRALDALRRTACAVAVAGVALAGGGLRGVAVASAAGAAVGAFASLLVLRREVPGWRRLPRWADVRRLLAYAKVVALLQPIGVITRQMDRLIVGAILGPAPVALVEIATQVQNGAASVLVASSYVAAPASSWVEAREEHGLLRELVVRGTKYSLLLTYPVAVLAMVLAGDLVHVWVGPAYAAAAGLTVLALIDPLLSAPLQVGSNVLVGTGRAPVLLRAAVAAVVVNLAASVVLVHVIGAAGAFVGTVVALVVLAPMLGRATCQAIGVGPIAFVRAAVLPAVAACVPAAAVAGLVVLAPLPHLVTLAVAGPVGLVAYGATAFRFGLSGSERTELGSILRRRSTGGPEG